MTFHDEREKQKDIQRKLRRAYGLDHTRKDVFPISPAEPVPPPDLRAALLGRHVPTPREMRKLFGTEPEFFEEGPFESLDQLRRALQKPEEDNS